MKKVILISMLFIAGVMFTSSASKTEATAPVPEKVKWQYTYICNNNHYHNCMCNAGRCLTFPYECPTCGSKIGRWDSYPCIPE